MSLIAVEVGTLAQWLTFFAFAVAAFFVWRGGGGAALGVLEVANRILEKRVGELEKQQLVDAKELAELRGATNFNTALAPLVLASEHHEERAAVRFERSMVVLDLIAARLGPDNGNGGG